VGPRGRRPLVDETTYFVTTTVVEFAQVFCEDEYCDILIRNIKHYQKQYKFKIYGYVIMPTHFHWIVEVKPEIGTISDVMRDLKKYSAWDLMGALEQNRRNDLAGLFRGAADGFVGQRRKFWMQRFDDEYIRDAEMLRVKLNYIHNNPVKAGLVLEPEDYKYSSARNYIRGDHSILFVETGW
jgi:REP-associated tyrosine transposase